jgi:hypothetical protein
MLGLAKERVHFAPFVIRQPNPAEQTESIHQSKLEFIG